MEMMLCLVWLFKPLICADVRIEIGRLEKTPWWAHEPKKTKFRGKCGVMLGKIEYQVFQIFYEIKAAKVLFWYFDYIGLLNKNSLDCSIRTLKLIPVQPKAYWDC
jgi:hypothetical protein